MNGFREEYNKEIKIFFNKNELQNFPDDYINNLLNKCEEECSLFGISTIDSNNFNILISNCIKDISMTITTCPKILKNIIYAYVIIRIYNYNISINHSDIMNEQQFLENYIEFSDLPKEEISLLLRFRNIIKITTTMLNNSLIKQTCMDIGTILEGTGKKYICGSGETIQTKRRVLIFRKEANVYPQKRFNQSYKRKNNSLFNLNNKNYNKNNYSKKKYTKKIIKSTNKSIIKNINIIEEDFEHDAQEQLSTKPILVSNMSTKPILVSNMSIEDEFIAVKIILYEENIEKKLLHMFNCDLFNDLNTY